MFFAWHKSFTAAPRDTPEECICINFKYVYFRLAIFLDLSYCKIISKHKVVL
jgi:hypothetical protein